MRSVAVERGTRSEYPLLGVRILLISLTTVRVSNFHLSVFMTSLRDSVPPPAVDEECPFKVLPILCRAVP